MQEEFKTRLARALTLRNIKPVELSEKSGIPKSGISQYLKGICIPKNKNILKISEVLNVNPDWLIGYSTVMDKNIKNANLDISSKTYPVPLYGEISAGLPNWAEECLEGYLPIAPELMGIVNPEEYFFLQVNGESMNKIVKNGAYALIHKQEYVENGEIAVVLVDNYSATLKRFRKENDTVVLYPESNDNSFYPQMYNKNTIIKVIGKYAGKLEINK